MRAKIEKVRLDAFGSYFGRDSGSLIVRDKDRKEKRYPLCDNRVGIVEIRSGNTVSSGALATCGFWDIPVLFETSRGHPVAILRSLYDDSHVKTRVCQYDALRNEKGEEIAKAFVLAKFEGQNQVLKKYGLKRIDYSSFETVKRLEAENLEALRRKLMSIEGKIAERYFPQIFGLFNEGIRPKTRRTYQAYDGVNNILSLGYRVLFWKVKVSLIKAKLEPYLGYLHGIVFGRPSLICDFLELYRYLIDDFVIEYARNLMPRSFILKSEDFSSNRKGKRQYLNDRIQRDFFERISDHFETKVNVPRIMHGKRCELETLIDEEALQFARYLRNEIHSWYPRLVALG